MHVHSKPAYSEVRASFSRRAFFSVLCSGLYLPKSLTTVPAMFLSTALVKRFSAGGTCRLTQVSPVHSR